MDDEYENEDQKVDVKQRHLEELKSRRTEEERLIILHRALEKLKEELNG